ncbi:MAG: sodium-dependent bicarbonate transport family permease [Alphaproteobacteria bacterium]|nr:sodium-dependent bicarbonate transport family permease [Alphaproteobacteria bacterium]
MSALDTLLSPAILFFVLGALAAFARSDLSIPESVAKGLSLYLMAAIGLKGGVNVASAGFDPTMLAAIGVGVGLSFSIPFIAAFLLRRVGGLDPLNAAAVAAHYGSVSVVTFAAAVDILTGSGIAPAGYMVAVLALMETPAILSGLVLARRGGAQRASEHRGELLREVLLNGSVVLLLGSFVIGLIAGKDGVEPIKPVFDTAFRGALCLFLLDMGLIAARRLLGSKLLNVRLVMLAILMPVFNGALGVVLGTLIGLDVGSAAGLGVLAASASYIAVPAAMRLALPQADPGLYLSLSLGVTFPFNVTFGIALMAWLAQRLAA